MNLLPAGFEPRKCINRVISRTCKSSEYLTVRCSLQSQVRGISQLMQFVGSGSKYFADYSDSVTDFTSKARKFKLNIIYFMTSQIKNKTFCQKFWISVQENVYVLKKKRKYRPKWSRDNLGMSDFTLPNVPLKAYQSITPASNRVLKARWDKDAYLKHRKHVVEGKLNF